MTDLTILPLSIVMVAGPQIITAVFLATSSSWGRNTAVFLGGAAISISLFVTGGFLIGGSGNVDTSETLSQVLDVVTIALLILAGIYVYRRRKKSEPPSWMGKLQTATPGLAFKLGFLLLGFFPTDIVTSLSVGRYLAREGASLWDGVPFVLLTLLLLALPALSVLLLGERGKAFLPKAREWMAANSWIISEAVIVFFIIVIW